MSDGNLLCSFPPVTQFNYGCKAVLSSRFTAFHKQTQLKNLGEGNFGTIGKITCQLSGLVPVRQQENVGRTHHMKKLTEKKTQTVKLPNKKSKLFLLKNPSNKNDINNNGNNNNNNNNNNDNNNNRNNNNNNNKRDPL